MNTMEARLRTAWCKVLDTEEDELDGESHFFQEGGDSVAAMRLIGVAEDYKIQLDNAIIYDFPVLKNMACNSHEIHVRSDGSETNATTQDLEEDLVQACANTCGVEQDAIEDIFPATETQERILGWHMKDGSAVLQYVFQIHGPAKTDLIREVVDVIRQKNQILRTRLVRQNGILYQVVVKDPAKWYEGTKLSEYWEHVFSQEGWVGYGDPLFRYAFIEEGRDLFFAYTSQHSGYDGWTNHLIFDALEEGLRDLEGLRQKPVRTQYKQFGKWIERRSAATDEAAKSMAFWDSYLSGFKGFANRIGAAPGYEPYETARVTRIMPLKRRASPFTLSTMAHAAWAISLGNIYQDDDVLFLTVTSGRRFPRNDPLPGVESVMGPVQIGVCLRTRLRAEQPISSLLRETQDSILSMIPYEREGPIARKILGPHLAYVSVFNWHPIGNDIPSRIIDFENPDGSITRLEGRRDLYTPFKVPIRIVVDVWEHHDHLRIIPKWDGNLYDGDHVALMLDQLTDNLSKILTSRVDCVGDLWTMRDCSSNEMVNGRGLEGRETPVVTPKALAESSSTGTDKGDALGTESIEGSASLTPSTMDPDSQIEYPSNESASPKVETSNLGIPHSDCTVDVSIINTTSFVRDIPVPVFLQPPYKGFNRTDLPVYSFLISHPPSGRKVLMDLGVRKDWEDLAPSVVERIKEIGMNIDVQGNITDILRAGGVDPKEINSVIWR